MEKGTNSSVSRICTFLNGRLASNRNTFMTNLAVGAVGLLTTRKLPVKVAKTCASISIDG